MGDRAKTRRQAIEVFELRGHQRRAAPTAWPAIEARSELPFDDDPLDDERFAGWMSADEIIDDLMLKLDDEDFWQFPLSASSVRH